MFRVIRMACFGLIISLGTSILAACNFFDFVGSIICLFAGGCSAGGNAAIIPPPPAPNQYPGTFVAASVDHNCPDSQSLQYSTISADEFAAQMEKMGWSDLYRLKEGAVNASYFGNPGVSADLMYFNGHGVGGAIAFDGCSASPNQTSWGVGSVGGSQYTNTVNMPVTGRQKWMLFDSSISMGYPVNQIERYPTIPEAFAAADWRPAFGGSLHGLYGNRPCDVYNETCPTGNDIIDRNDGVGRQFAVYSTQRYPGMDLAETVHQSWVDASRYAQRDNYWAMWEDVGARNDHLSAPGAGAAYVASLGGQKNVFYYSSIDPQGVNPDASTVYPSNATFVLRYYQIKREPFDHTVLPALLPGSTAVDDGTVYSQRYPTIAGVDHFYNSSGGIILHGEEPQYPVIFTQAVALNAALQFLANTPQGVPPDMGPVRVLTERSYDPETSSQVVTGYEFIWQRTSNIVGGDAIKVVVNDEHVETDRCLLHEKCTGDCLKSVTTVTDKPYVSFAYRLWHQQTIGCQGRCPIFAPNEVIVPGTGLASIDAATAALALPANTYIVSYAPGNWTPMINSSSMLELPVWVFNLLNGVQVSVDAYTGEILSTTRL